jgi:signal peptidase I
MHKIRYIQSKQLFPVVQELLKTGVSATITVTGMSMYPFLREDMDSVELSASSFVDIHLGDIVLILRESDEYVLHRVLRKDMNCFYIIGDAQQWVEGPLYPNQLIAVVTAVWRKNKRIEYTNFWWKLLSSIWMKLIPFRYLLIRIYKYLLKISKIHMNLWRRLRT